MKDKIDVRNKYYEETSKLHYDAYGKTEDKYVEWLEAEVLRLNRICELSDKLIEEYKIHTEEMLDRF